VSIHVDYLAAGSGNANRRNSLAAVKSRFEESMKSIVSPLESTATSHPRARSRWETEFAAKR
jgi:hypothetical protein